METDFFDLTSFVMGVSAGWWALMMLEIIIERYKRK